LNLAQAEYITDKNQADSLDEENFDPVTDERLVSSQNNF
jgi:hypothetical protein